MAAISPMDGLPAELLAEILCRLSWRQQLTVRRVSRRWQAAVDACLARRQELHLSKTIDADCLETVYSILQHMPALRRLCIVGWRRLVYKKLALDALWDDPELDPPAVERLCTSCPRLEEVSLDSDLSDAAVQTLLRRLPGLRVLHLPGFRSEGGFLSLLPAGLHALSVGYIDWFDRAALGHLARCPQLRELRLDDVELRDSKLATALSACPQLERLSVSFCCPQSPTLARTRALARCPKLRELQLWGGRECEIDISSVLAAGSRLERLLVNDCVIRFSTRALRAIRLRRQVGLTHLCLSDLTVDDSMLSQLADLLPNLLHLTLEHCGRGELTERGLASGLRRFRSLQFLVLGHSFTLNPDSSVLPVLGDLPLKAFTCHFGSEPETAALGVARVLSCCPTLTVLRLPWTRLASFSSFVDELAGDPPERREVTLLVPRGVAHEAARLPMDLRVAEDRAGLWWELAGWPPWRSCCCSDGHGRCCMGLHCLACKAQHRGCCNDLDCEDCSFQHCCCCRDLCC